MGTGSVQFNQFTIQFQDEEKLRHRLKSFLEIGRLYYEHKRGLKFFESIIRYLLYATEINSEELSQKIKQISSEGGYLAMSTAMKLIEQGRKEERRENLLGWIHDILEIKFASQGLSMMDKIKTINDTEVLRELKEKIKKRCNS